MIMSSNIISIRPPWLNQHVWTIKRDKAYFGMHVAVPNQVGDDFTRDKSRIYVFRTKKKAQEFASNLAGTNGSGLMSLRFERSESVDWNLFQTFEMEEILIVKEEFKMLKKLAKIVDVDLRVVDSTSDGRICRNNVEVSMEETKNFLNEMMMLR